MKTYYSDYVGRAARYYFNNPDITNFPDDINERNWKAVRDSLEEFALSDRQIIKSVLYGSSLVSLKENVIATQLLFNVSQSYVYKVLSDFEKAVARKCKLIV